MRKYPGWRTFARHDGDTSTEFAESVISRQALSVMRSSGWIAGSDIPGMPFIMLANERSGPGAALLAAIPSWFRRHAGLSEQAPAHTGTIGLL